MKQVRQTMTGILIGMGIYAVLVECVGFFFSDNIIQYTCGLLLGIVVAIALLFHMMFTLDKALDLPQAQASRYVKKQSFIRLAIMLLAMIFALAIQYVNFIATILGMLGLKVGSLLAPVILKKRYPEEYITDLEDDCD